MWTSNSRPTTAAGRGDASRLSTSAGGSRRTREIKLGGFTGPSSLLRARSRAWPPPLRRGWTQNVCTDVCTVLFANSGRIGLSRFTHVFSGILFGGRTRTRTLNPLIKSHVVWVQYQSAKCNCSQTTLFQNNGIRANCKRSGSALTSSQTVMSGAPSPETPEKSDD